MKSNEETAAKAAAAATAAPPRKRRLSKKERKALKKKQKRNQKPLEATQAREDFEASYVATPVPPDEVDDEDQQSASASGKGAKKLGKWFPTAVVIKSQTIHNSATQGKKKKSTGDDAVATKSSSLVLFYQYANPPFRPSQVRQLMTYLTTIAKSRNLGGRIRVANEGVNCTVSSLPLCDDGAFSAAANLRHFAEDLKTFSPVFNDTDFKYIDNLPPDRHFKELKIMPVKELVYYGISEEDAPLGAGGVHLEAKEYHKMLARDDAVVIDVRNHYEALIGRFDGQVANASSNKTKVEGNEQSNVEENDGNVDSSASQAKGGATYIDPQMRKSTDFPDWLAKPETKEKLANKKVLMFCTGGVRCERASAYLKKQMGDQVDGVYQLQGGIERYMQEFKDGGGYWRGKNFVFDKREAVAVDNVAGDGGVVRRDRGRANSAAMPEDARCCCCNTPWDRYIGKRKCNYCGVPVLICDICMTNQKGGKAKNDIRCDLCREEGITVKASEVIWTDNGIHGQPNNEADDEGEAGKAARSVLKWGGGHAVEKKKARKLARKPCRFGSECARKDCMFYHPERKRDENTTG